MKILHVINDLSAAGAQKVVFDLSLGAKRLGHEVDVIVLESCSSHFETELKGKGVNVISLNNKHHIYNPLNIFKILKLMSGYDIVHSHLFPTQYWVSIAKRLKKKLPIIITTEHNTTNKRRKSKFWNLIDKFIYKKYDKIIPCSEEAGKAFGKCFPTIDYEVIPNGVDISSIKSAPLSTKTELFGLDENTTCICMVARLQYPKRQDILIEAISKLPDNYHAIIVGEGINKEKLENLANELGIKDRVHFMGVRADIATIIKTCDINCLITEYEGLSISSIECMAAGRPFIASNAPGLRDMADGAGVIVNNDSNELASAIHDLKVNKAEAVAERCSTRAQKYDILKTVEDYVTIYQSCIESARC